jgi:UDPglucose--hexose-1-phosphate uridylyltransferase
VFALASEGREPNTPGWRVRVVPNLYPAFERQEVVIHTPRHARSLAELDDVELGDLAAAWGERAAANDGYVHPIINEGRAAGGSLPHSHSQLVWLPEAPPVVRAEREGGLTQLLDDARSRNTIVADGNGLVAFCHPAGRVPYEAVIMPDPAADSWPDPDTLGAAFFLLRDVIVRLRAVEGAVPWNAWLHHGTTWHFEVVPRLTVLAGLELGAGIYINPLAPEDAAARLRS